MHQDICALPISRDQCHLTIKVESYITGDIDVSQNYGGWARLKGSQLTGFSHLWRPTVGYNFCSLANTFWNATPSCFPFFLYAVNSRASTRRAYVQSHNRKASTEALLHPHCAACHTFPRCSCWQCEHVTKENDKGVQAVKLWLELPKPESTHRYLA